MTVDVPSDKCNLDAIINSNSLMKINLPLLNVLFVVLLCEYLNFDGLHNEFQLLHFALLAGIADISDCVHG